MEKYSLLAPGYVAFSARGGTSEPNLVFFLKLDHIIHNQLFQHS